jgi:prepilin-type N-terminal cleavage/methylation domain-containing protein
MQTRRNRRKGFTLTEILVALAIFALGGTAIMALFITNIRLSRDAMDHTRAAEITRNVRSLMTMSLSRPIPAGDTQLYQFSYPGTSLTFNPRRHLDEEGRRRTGTASLEAVGGDPVANTIFFRLPTQTFNAQTFASAGDQMITRLPSNALQPTGSPRAWGADGDPRVFRFVPDSLRRAGALDGLDQDDRISYQFDMDIRRSVMRSSVQGRDGMNQPLEDLFVVHIRVYKGFEFEGDVQNDPFFEWDFYVTATR